MADGGGGDSHGCPPQLRPAWANRNGQRRGGRCDMQAERLSRSPSPRRATPQRATPQPRRRRPTGLLRPPRGGQRVSHEAADTAEEEIRAMAAASGIGATASVVNTTARVAHAATTGATATDARRTPRMASPPVRRASRTTRRVTTAATPARGRRCKPLATRRGRRCHGTDHGDDHRHARQANSRRGLDRKHPQHCQQPSQQDVHDAPCRVKRRRHEATDDTTRAMEHCSYHGGRRGADKRRREIRGGRAKSIEGGVQLANTSGRGGVATTNDGEKWGRKGVARR